MRKALFSLLLIIASCGVRMPEVVYEPVPYDIGVPMFPDSLNIPPDNPMTVDGVRLGRYLFYDGRLSGDPDRPMSCATCHRQEHAFECGTEKFEDGRPAGNSGKKTPHVMLPLFNLAWNNSGYFWNGYVQEGNIESTVPMAITAPHEMDGNIRKAVELIKKEPMYREMFYKAFGSTEINIDRISKAIAQFVRSIVSFNSKFDQFMDGKVQLTKQEMRGLMLFTTEGADCFHCHGSPALPLWTTNLFMNNAKDIDFEGEKDRFSVTGNPMDKGKYRVPSLRNIEFTGPYMHDGRFKTLDEVLEFYNNGLKRSPYIDPLSINANHGGSHLSESDLMAVKAFLLTLSDSTLLNDARYGDPWQGH